MDEARRRLGDRIIYAASNYDALKGADALLIHTEWLPYRRPDFPRMKDLMNTPLILDGRNIYRPERMAEYGFEYFSIGRPAVTSAGGQG
jgi:UDPglucose 6-dehydrogenase